MRSSLDNELLAQSEFRTKPKHIHHSIRLPFSAILELVQSTPRRAMLQSLEDVPVALILPFFDLLRCCSLRVVGVWVRKDRCKIYRTEAKKFH